MGTPTYLEHTMSHVIITPGKKWIPTATVVAKSNTNGDAEVSGYYRRQPGGVSFYELDGTLFAFLVTNKHRERFFVTASDTSEGVRYMFSTCSITQRKLGIDHLGHTDTKKLEDEIVDALDAHRAREALSNQGVSFEQFVGMANRKDTSAVALKAFHKAGLTTELQGIESDGYLLATTLGRVMLRDAGYDHIDGVWTQTARPAAA